MSHYIPASPAHANCPYVTGYALQMVLLAGGHNTVILSNPTHQEFKTCYWFLHVMEPALVHCFAIGLATGSQILTRLLDQVPGNVKFKFVYNYLDDLVVYSDSFVWIKAFRDFPPSKDTKGVSRFVGMVNFYSKFIPKFIEHAAPLNALREKGAKFQQDTFDFLKQVIAILPVLRTANFSKPFILQTDASSTTLGNQWVKATYHFHFTKTHQERKSSAYELECSVVVFGTNKFRQFLEHRELLETHNQALLWLLAYPKQLRKYGLIMHIPNFLAHSTLQSHFRDNNVCIKGLCLKVLKTRVLLLVSNILPPHLTIHSSRMQSASTGISFSIAFHADSQDRWDQYLEWLRMAFNYTHLEGDKTTPFKLMFTYKPNTPLSIPGSLAYLLPDDPKDIKEIWKRAHEHLRLSDGKSKRRYGKECRQNPFKVGDFVLCRAQTLINAIEKRVAKLAYMWNYVIPNRRLAIKNATKNKQNAILYIFYIKKLTFFYFQHLLSSQIKKKHTETLRQVSLHGVLCNDILLNDFTQSLLGGVAPQGLRSWCIGFCADCLWIQLPCSVSQAWFGKYPSCGADDPEFWASFGDACGSLVVSPAKVGSAWNCAGVVTCFVELASGVVVLLARDSYPVMVRAGGHLGDSWTVKYSGSVVNC
ncbi:hypothetical protein PR048_015916 [Dryococelus australis]|uniref:Reverse transcriptase/retrotransposon-derived protein RNase H-like domain-containing protein n=1 Tax=Dryococelus australis TaxID=614101 RepID=A0ABQ9HIB6_9NEOP|nr:hypothetical protein PR048_015916 [Dryococelus australis]